MMEAQLATCVELGVQEKLNTLMQLSKGGSTVI